jgi:hypothetical protein
MKILICFLILAICGTGPGLEVKVAYAAQTGAWQMIATTEVRFTADHEGVVVQGPYNNFNHIKYKVTDAPIRMVKTVITYDNGSPDNIETLYDIPQDGESRVIELRGVGQRKIRRIDFWYAPRTDAGGHAHITIFGSK